MAGTAPAQALGHDVLTHFGIRLVLQTLDDETIHLLGRPGVGGPGPGQLLVGVDSRAPIHVRGFASLRSTWPRSCG